MWTKIIAMFITGLLGIMFFGAGERKAQHRSISMTGLIASVLFFSALLLILLFYHG